MSGKAVNPVRMSYGGSAETTAAARAVQEALGKLPQNVRITSGRYIADVALNGATEVKHGLKRIPEGWAIVDIDDAATVHRTAWDTQTITLDSSAAVTVRLEVW